MTENDAPTNEESSVPAMSLGGRLTNVFVAPSEVFEDVRKSPPQPVNWIVPLIAMMIFGIIYSMVVFSQPTIIQQMKEAAEQKVDASVKAGKITRQMADQQNAVMEKIMTPTFFKVFGIVGTIIGQPIFLFLIGIVFWLIGRFAFHAEFDYMKAVEAVGLSNLVSIPGAIVTIALVVIYNNLAMTPGPILLVGHFDQHNPWHVLLSSLNVVFIWYVSVLSIALARLSRTSFLKAALWGFGLWGVLVAVKLGFVMISGGK